MIEFKRDEKTGELIAYKDGKPVGAVATMGDEIKKEPEESEENG